MATRLYRVLWATLLTFALALLPFGPVQSLPTLHLGFPSRFFTIHCTAAGEFALSFSIGAFTINVVAFYGLLILLKLLYGKIRRHLP